MYSIDSITSVKNAISDSYGECEQGLTNNKDLMFMVIYMHVGVDMIVMNDGHDGQKCPEMTDIINILLCP